MFDSRIFCPILMLFSPVVFAENPYTLDETLAIERECINLGRNYARYLDNGEAEKISALFVEHGTYVSTTTKYVGRQDIATAFSRRPKNRQSFHMVANETAEVLSKNLAVVESYYVYYRYEGDVKGEYAPISLPYSMGTYHDECIRSDNNEWLFQIRITKRRFSSAVE
jgi:hypothetical protein